MMDKKLLIRLHRRFEGMVCRYPDIETEFWCARDLQELLGYATWQNFSKVINKAITACEKAGYETTDHFAGITKKVDLGSGAKQRAGLQALYLNQIPLSKKSVGAFSILYSTWSYPVRVQ